MFPNMDLRDFKGILLYFSDQEIAELQAAIDERCRARAHLDDDASETGCSPKSLEEGSPRSISETG